MPPAHAAAAIDFTDTDTNGGEIAGTVTIEASSDESDITDYVLYWGSDATTKQSATPIDTLPVTGADVTYVFGADTVIPVAAGAVPAATHLLVFTRNADGEMSTPVAELIVDDDSGDVAPVQLTPIETQTTLYVSGAVHTFTATATGASSYSYSLANAPGDAAIDSSTGVFTWTLPSTTSRTTYTFDVRVEDTADSSRYAEQQVAVHVVGRTNWTATLSGGILTLMGNSADNYLEIVVDGGVVSFVGATSLGTYSLSSITVEARVFAGNGHDYVKISDTCGGALKGRIVGGSGDDTLIGGCGTDNIDGQAGVDVLKGNDGDDQLFGGTENDFLYGGAGADQIYGQDGDDSLYGGAGADQISGQAGNDTLYEIDASDTIVSCGGDDDTVVGGLNGATNTNNDCEHI